ncbi:MAG TPA: CCA tRNA nucleotidyltransferase [Candidatus Woesebacteria bacterium]|nr:CCA tRNA nucleotidyltransferase [Candidatus Woesebacteria bacterium]HNS65204.1 CCA tRNA nucleotidyltransferase [Candidatus Woesebacteria bacterium]
MLQVPSQLTLALEPLIVLHELNKAGFANYIVGGAVRDLLLSNEKWLFIDFDLTTNASPQQLLTIFPFAFYENTFGTVSLTYQHLWDFAGIDLEYRKARELVVTSHQIRKTNPTLIDLLNATKIHTSLLEHTEKPPLEPQKAVLPLIEVTTFRSGEKYQNGARRPSEVQWGHSLIEDLKRRDFTINALALKLDPDWIETTFKQFTTHPPNLQGIPLDQSVFELIDRHNGITDLESGLVRTVGIATERIQEDALRMLRAIRFAVQLGFTLDPELVEAIKQHALLLKDVSPERIRDEFFKMLVSDHPKQAIELLDETQLLEQVLPELLSAKGVRQGGHHTTDVWQHSIDALQACPSKDPIVRLATLIHDIAKPATYDDAKGQPTFYNHEVIGARVAKQIGQRLRLSKNDCDRLFVLVRYHMFHYQPENSDAAIRRFMRKVGLQHIDDILDLREADRLGSGARKTSWRLEEMKERMVAQLHQPFDSNDLAIDGHDLIDQLGLKPGKLIGTILQTLLEIVLENPEKNTKEILLEIARAELEQSKQKKSVA